MAKKSAKKLKVAALGGLGEIGKNLTVIEYGDDMIVIDCGMGFPDDDMLGVDLVIPDLSYLKANASKIRGVFLTHGHEDHIGAIPYLLDEIDVPIYGTRLTIGIIKYKLEEHKIPFKPRLNCVEAGDVIGAGSMAVEFIHVNHSIADACALAVFTPFGTVIPTGDFKLDLTPIDGEVMDLTRFGELGREGVLLMMCESTNAERPGFTPSEKTVGESLKSIFMRHHKKRIVITTFSSNVHRVQQIIDISVAHKRKVAVIGRSMQNIVSAAIELGYMHVPDGAIIDIGDVKNYNPENVTVITTGSQGEPMSALYRMAFADRAKLSLGNDDLVVISANPIPGNEKMVDKIINEFTKNNVTVFRDSSVETHVSGHACQGEIKLLHALLRPRYFMPIHGEHKHLAANRDVARSMGQDANTIFVGDTGKILEISAKSAKFNGAVPSGVLFVDGSGVGDVGNIVLRDRKHLSEEGIIVVVASVSLDEQLLLSGPEIITRGFVYMREAEELITELRHIAYDTLYDALDRGIRDWSHLKNMIKDDLARYIYSKTRRRPMILPILLDE